MMMSTTIKLVLTTAVAVYAAAEDKKNESQLYKKRG